MSEPRIEGEGDGKPEVVSPFISERSVQKG